MPLRCIEFSGWISWLATEFILIIILHILTWAVIPIGLPGIFGVGALRAGVALLGIYFFLDMIGTVTGLRGKCPQGYRTFWPLFKDRTYHRNADGLRVDDPHE